MTVTSTLPHAAWADSLLFTQHKALLDGIESADSVAISAHKWFYLAKDSAMLYESVMLALGHTSSRTSFAGQTWVRQVAANPQVDIGAVKQVIIEALV